MPHLQLKDIPPGVHAALRARADLDGVSMREYVLRLIEADLGRQDSWDDTLRRVREAEPPAAAGTLDAAALIRELRDEREEHLLDVISPRR